LSYRGSGSTNSKIGDATRMGYLTDKHAVGKTRIFGS